MNNRINCKNQSDLTLIGENEIKMIEFSPGHKHNPFNNYRIERLRQIIVQLNNDDTTKIIILYGGEGNSFSVGGDFNETSQFKGGKEVDFWIDNITKTYISILSSKIPIIAAIDNYAIGFGLQIALLCDYIIASENAKLQMPELEKGISCNFGALILEKTVGRSVMQKLVFGCNMIYAEEAERLGLVHEICETKDLLGHTMKIAKKFATYPNSAVVETKNTMNREFIHSLKAIQRDATLSHKRAFSQNIAQKYMTNIISKNIVSKNNLEERISFFKEYLKKL